MRINPGFLVMMERTRPTGKEARKNQKIKKKTNLEKERKVGSRSEVLKRKPYGGKSPRFLVKRNGNKNSTTNVKNSGILKNVFCFGFWSKCNFMLKILKFLTICFVFSFRIENFTKNMSKTCSINFR